MLRFPHKANAPVLVTFLQEPFFLHTCNGHAVSIIKTSCISKVFDNLRLLHQTCARGKINIV